MQNKPNQSRDGGAFFILFIAIALFAGLSFAFLQTTRQSTNFLSIEQTNALANEIMAYALDLEQGARRLSLRGCTPDTIEFETANSSAPDDGSCSLFRQAGAGLSVKDIPDEALDTPASAQNITTLLKVEGVGDTVKTDIVLRVTHLKPEICRKINELVKLTPADTAPPQDTFTAAQTDTNISNGIDDSIAVALGDTATILEGEKGFCYEDTGTTSYDFVRILIAR